MQLDELADKIERKADQMEEQVGKQQVAIAEHTQQEHDSTHHSIMSYMTAWSGACRLAVARAVLDLKLGACPASMQHAK